MRGVIDIILISFICDFSVFANSFSYNGVDITYGVAYFRGGPQPILVPDFPPGGNTDVYLLKFDSQ